MYQYTIQLIYPSYLHMINSHHTRMFKVYDSNLFWNHKQ